MRSFLEDLTQDVGAFLLSHHRNVASSEIEFKGPRDVVSYVDRQAEARIREAILKAYPDDGILGEEGEDHLGTSGRRWIVDPLDGTNNYLHGTPFYAISIGVEDPEGMLAGCIHAPSLGWTFLAERGQGATKNGEPIRIAPAKTLSEALLATGFADARTHDLLRTTRLERLLNQAGGIRRMGSAALDLAMTAEGVYDGFFEWNLSPWDVAAGALLVQEAGGKVCDAHGKDDWLFGRTIVAANPNLLPQLTEALANPVAEDRLSLLQDHMRSFVEARGWTRAHSPKNVAMALSVEASELAEVFQWIDSDRAHKDQLSTHELEAAREELADVLAYTLSMSNALGFDLADAYFKKMKKNAAKYPVDSAQTKKWSSPP